MYTNAMTMKKVINGAKKAPYYKYFGPFIRIGSFCF